MATGIGNLPFTPTYVSPFDVITSQAENETQDNISALADGSGIGDGALDGAVALQDNSVTSGKIDYTTFSGSTTQWRSWTPTLTNFTGTVNTARYTLTGKTCYFYIKVTQGASVTGRHTFTLPVTASSALDTVNGVGTIIATGSILDLGTAVFRAEGGLTSTTTCGLVVNGSFSGYSTQNPSSATVPMTWVNGNDGFHLYGRYETA